MRSSKKIFQDNRVERRSVCVIHRRRIMSRNKETGCCRSHRTVLAHDITEIRPGEFKGRAFKKGHIIREEDVCHLQRLGKENLFVLNIADDEMHEDDAAMPFQMHLWVRE